MEKQVFYIGLLMLLASVAMGAPCSNVIPGLFWQSRGVDVSKLDLLPLDLNHAQDGYMSPIVDFTCDQKKKRVIDGVTYNQPDQVWVVTELPSGALVGTQTLMRTSNEARNSFSVSAGVDVNIKKFGFSASSTYSKTQTTILKREKMVESVAASFSSRSMELQHVDSLQMGQHAKREVDELPETYTADTGAYERFIQQFGTHYSYEARFGGAMVMYMETSTSYHETNNEETIEAQASATFSQVLTIKGGTSISNAEIDSKFTSATSKAIRYYGGNWNLMASDGLSMWQPTISKNPWLFSAKLNRISDLIREAPKKKAAMNQAIDDYLMRQYISVELVRVLDTLSTAAQSNSDVTKLKSRINTMKTKYPLVQSEVEDLGEDVFDAYAERLIAYDTSIAQWSGASAYDAQVNFQCPAGKTIRGIKSSHSNYYEDRSWQFLCYYAPQLASLENCRWTGYLNSYDGALDYDCPGNAALKGWNSVHSDYYEDRRHKFMCCDLPDLSLKCADSGYKNSMDGNMDFVTNLIRGAYSYHSDYYEDRRWKFNVCTVQ